ncbi:sugar efflux transporter [Alteromonas gilva]
MSLFIVEGLHSPPAYIGMYTVAVTLAGLVFSQWLGTLADKGISARKMFMIAVSGMAAALLVFANTSSFWVVLVAGVILFSMGNAAIPQVLTLGRQWAVQQPDVNLAQFNARLRAAISFAWIGGPPLGYALAAGVDFDRSFYMAAFFALVALCFAAVFIPEVATSSPQASNHRTQKTPAYFWLMVLAITFGSVGNIMYSSALPLYVINELGFATHTPGIFMGLVACLEIPVMLYAGKLAHKRNKIKMFGVAFGCAMVFYIGVFFATQVWQLIALQFINALFYGVFAGLGLTILQDQLPARIGFTAAVYSNAIKVGMMLGTTATGVLAQFFSFRFATIGAFCAAGAALSCLLLFNYRKNLARNAGPNHISGNAGSGQLAGSQVQ